MAIAAGDPGRRPDPGRAPSSSSASPRRRRPASARRRSRTSRRSATSTSRTGYFRGGTHMHLSHLVRGPRGLVSATSTSGERVDTIFRPGLRRAGGHADGAAGPRRRRRRPTRDGATSRRTGAIGHSGSIQPTSRLAAGRSSAPTATVYAQGHGDPAARRLQHARQPVLLERGPGARPPWASSRRAGVHFVVFNPSSDDFHRNRLAMDGVLPGRHRSCRSTPRDRGPGLQLGPPDDAPPELPRAAAPAPLLPARRAPALADAEGLARRDRRSGAASGERST